MATTEVRGGAPGRPRPWLLVLLGVVVVLALLVRVWPGNSAAPAAGPSNAARPAQPRAGEAIDPADLDVRLEALTAEQRPRREGDRNPFRFAVKPPPPPPPAPPIDVRAVPDRHEPEASSEPPPPPPIPMKFIGILEPKPGDRIAVFSDCRITPYAREGDVVVGQYRLVRIGVESVVMEYLDGRGRTTIRLQGQECVGK